MIWKHNNIFLHIVKGETMNLKLRFKNKATLVALASALIAFIYQILGILGIIAPIAQDAVSQLVGIILNILVAVGVLVGIGDSVNAMSYEELGQAVDPDYQGPADLTEEPINITHKEEV